MDAILKASAAAVVCAAALTLIKKYIPEYAPFAQIAAMLAVFFSVSQVLEYTIKTCSDFLSSGAVDYGYAVQLFKALGVAVAGKLGGEICRDSDNSSLAFVLETAAKAVVISMSLPMLKNLADVVAGLLKG